MELIKTSHKSLITICILLILTLAACEKTKQAHEDIGMENEQRNIFYSFKNPNTGQEFTIIHAYLLYEDYFETVNADPAESHSKLFRQAINPIYEACFQDAEYYRFSVFEWVPEESDFTRIKSQIESIDKDYINELFEEALVKSSDLLASNNKTTVCVFPQNERFVSDMMTAGIGKIIITFSENEYYSKPGMAHEYHHSVWMEKHYTVDHYLTVLDHLILEGQAVMFETLVYPDSNSTDYAVDESFNKEHWSKIEKYLESSHRDEFLLGGSNGLPYNYGYSEGYKMVRSYLNLHPDMTVEEWTAKSPKEIYEEGNYTANYQ